MPDGVLLTQLKAQPVLKQMIVDAKRMMLNCKKRYSWSKRELRLTIQQRKMGKCIIITDYVFQMIRR